MGGPLVCHYLMPDGCFIPDCNPSARFSSDGRHFVSPIPSRGAWGLAIFDRQERLLYRCAVDNFWELDSVTEREVIGRHSPLTSNAPQRLELQALKAGSEAEAFVAIGDLWLPESEWQRWSGDLRAQPLPSPLGGPALEIRPWLPDSLLALDDPFAPLRASRGELWINGEASGLYLSREAPPLAWNDDGRALALQAAGEPLGQDTYWLWREDGGLRALGAPWSALPAEPHAGGPELLGLEDGWLRFGLDLAQPCLTYERYGTLGSYSHSSLYLLHARDADDRPRWREADMPRLDLLLPLDGAAGRPGCLLQSAPLADGSRAVWEWLRDDQEAERGAYALRLGDWRLDGEWTLDHRVSDCGRYLAVVAFAEAPTLPQRLAILDSRERRLGGSPSRWPIYTCKVSSMARCICSTCSAATPTSRRAGRAKATPACCAASTKACPSPAPGTHSAASTTTGGITTSRRGWRSMARPGGCAPRRAGWTHRRGPGATATSSCRQWARRTPPGASVSTTRACTATRTCAPGSAATATC